MNRQSNHVRLWARPAFNADRWVRDFFGPAAAEQWFTPLPAGFNPAAEIVRDGDDAVVRIEIPGVDVEKDVTVEVVDGRLVVRGERRDEYSGGGSGSAGSDGASPDGKESGRSLSEVRYGAFRRSFALPEHITGDDITASYDAGVLAVRVAGAHKTPAAAGARRIAIESS